jgi:hypothetical protein
MAILGVLLVGAMVAERVRTHRSGAPSRDRGQRTAAMLRNLGFALESRAVDSGGFPPSSDLATMAPALEGKYTQRVPRVDGWNRPLRYESDGSGREGRYFVGSAGADGRWERTRLAEYRDLPGRSGDDLVYSNGGFVTAPR